MKAQFTPGRRVVFPNGDGSAFLGTLVERDDTFPEYWHINWDDNTDARHAVAEDRLVLLQPEVNLAEWLDALLTPRQHRFARIVAAAVAVLPISLLVAACTTR